MGDSDPAPFSFKSSFFANTNNSSSSNGENRDRGRHGLEPQERHRDSGYRHSDRYSNRSNDDRRDDRRGDDRRDDRRDDRDRGSNSYRDERRNDRSRYNSSNSSSNSSNSYNSNNNSDRYSNRSHDDRIGRDRDSSFRSESHERSNTSYSREPSGSRTHRSRSPDYSRSSNNKRDRPSEHESDYAKRHKDDSAANGNGKRVNSGGVNNYDNNSGPALDFTILGNSTKVKEYFDISKPEEASAVAYRTKQVSYGKNTIGYDNYIATVPKHMRKGYREHPRTPDPTLKLSKRCFEGLVKVWRITLHNWDHAVPASSSAKVESAPSHNSKSSIDISSPSITASGVGVASSGHLGCNEESEEIHEEEGNEAAGSDDDDVL